MRVKPYKGRTISVLKPVEMYRCLNRTGFTFSLRQEGKVVGHTDSIALKDCDLIVNESGKNRCITNKQRNVHAYVKGYLTDYPYLSFSWLLRYNPYKDKGFFINQNDLEVEIDKDKCVYITDKKIYCQV